MRAIEEMMRHFIGTEYMIVIDMNIDDVMMTVTRGETNGYHQFKKGEVDNTIDATAEAFVQLFTGKSIDVDDGSKAKKAIDEMVNFVKKGGVVIVESDFDDPYTLVLYKNNEYTHTHGAYMVSGMSEDEALKCSRISFTNDWIGGGAGMSWA